MLKIDDIVREQAEMREHFFVVFWVGFSGIVLERKYFAGHFV